MYIHKEVQFPVRYLEGRCTGPICRWRHSAYDKEEPEARIILFKAWDAHLAQIREQAEVIEAFNRKNEESGGALAIKLNIVMSAIAAVIVGLLLWGVWSLVSGGGSDSSDSPWDSCSGYREDVDPGSAQDVRDVENGDNPC